MEFSDIIIVKEYRGCYRFFGLDLGRRRRRIYLFRVNLGEVGVGWFGLGFFKVGRGFF